MPEHSSSDVERSAREDGDPKEHHGFAACIGRRDFLVALAAAAAAGCTTLRPSAPRTAQKTRPNVLLIYIDDLGYADLGCQGATDLRTPHIDSLAQSGVRFTSGYVTAPLCSPSRAALMTGRYQQRFGHEYNTGNMQRQAAEDIGLPLPQRTLADALKEQGYATGVIGKWHLGVKDKFHPQRRGFDEFFGFLGGGHSYIEWGDAKRGAILRGAEIAQGDEYLTDAFSREAVEFIRRHQDEPFFLYLSYNAVHTPMQAPQKYLDRFLNIADPKRRTLAAMLSAMDDGVGQVLQTLRHAGIEENTLIFCISDNGGPTAANASRNDPLRSGKGSMYEGGIRVPFILRWPRRVPAGIVYADPVSTLDVFPTAVAAAGGVLPQDRVIDGVNLVPHLTRKQSIPPHEILLWRMGARFAIRKGKWKLVKSNSPDPELYDLSTDMGEADDVAPNRPELVEKLMAEYSRWDAQTVEPVWDVPRLSGRDTRNKRPQPRPRQPERRTRSGQNVRRPLILDHRSKEGSEA